MRAIVAVGTAVPSGRTTLTLRFTIAGGSGTGMETVPLSGTMTVMDEACIVAPLGRVPPESVKVTGPVTRVVRANPPYVVDSVLDALLLRVPGASGAVQRTDVPTNACPLAVMTVRATEDRALRVPVITVIGM